MPRPALRESEPELPSEASAKPPRSLSPPRFFSDHKPREASLKVSTMGMCPLLKKETIEKEPCDSKGYTHTASILVVFTLRKPVPLLGGVSSQPVQQAIALCAVPHGSLGPPGVVRPAYSAAQEPGHGIRSGLMLNSLALGQQQKACN
eukprot:g3405.t1